MQKQAQVHIQVHAYAYVKSIHRIARICSKQMGQMNKGQRLSKSISEVIRRCTSILRRIHNRIRRIDIIIISLRFEHEYKQHTTV